MFSRILTGALLRKSTITRTTETEEIKTRFLAVFSVAVDRTGNVRKVEEYIDQETGEIIPADELGIRVLDLRTKLPARAKALKSLRPEVRKFASFVLKFANKRRGITPGIHTLCRWYADLTGKRSNDVRRYIPALEKAGILAGEALLGRLFQRTASSVAQVMGEEFSAWATYERMRAAAFDPIKGTQRNPAPAGTVALEVAALEAELRAEQVAEAAIHKAATESRYAARPVEAACSRC